MDSAFFYFRKFFILEKISFYGILKAYGMQIQKIFNNLFQVHL
jgi:hypothetical protein